MNRLLSVSLLLLFAISSCREPDSPQPASQPEPEPIVNYQSYLEPVKEAVFKERLLNFSPGFPTYWPQDRYLYTLPCFNPQDPYEIAYLRTDSEIISDCPMALFIFSFRTGEARQVSNNACYGLDWSNTGWLIYTGIDRKVWKVKADGDSLTQLAFGSGFHNDPKWSPNGKSFIYERILMTENGDLIGGITETFRPLAWINDSSILGSHGDPSKGLINYSIPSKQVESFIPNENLPGISYFRSGEMDIFVDPSLRRLTYFLRFDLQTQQIDTIRRTYTKYRYGVGDYTPQTKHAIVQLSRQDWKDSIANEIYSRSHLLMLDENGEELGIVQLPE
ncbi:MAG: hypothetical protein AAGI38_05215 [Bacteroidota bacterium]